MRRHDTTMEADPTKAGTQDAAADFVLSNGLRSKSG